MSQTYYSTVSVVRLGEKIIGRIEGDSFIKPVCASKHQLRTPPAWAIDARAFDEQIRPIAKEIRVVDRETGTVWSVSVALFDQYKVEFNRGFGVQYLLPLSRWTVKENGDGSRQLPLWEGSL